MIEANDNQQVTQPPTAASQPRSTTVQLSALIQDSTTLERLALALQYAPEALAEVLGVELPGLLDSVGAYHVACPGCSAKHVECTLLEAPDETWTCPSCGVASAAHDWMQSRRALRA
ncbi:MULTISPECIES: hypothetical protein [unclassified Deinococcus]|uniref:hypothetical protein n=1 Tax=unclassified Deinococcus TaxID=2623546 RepID=UPI0009937605|nr:MULTISPECIES: hypothetical protein [unclassified Deinococcus]MBX8466861.1 hypothetical protein [Deinococcus sp. RIT780]NTX99196.1 hypothetical protein [Deinococcus sp. JMULE3]OOV12180.1 hypothetical protein BXU09_17915 [Deinococcus sp. LM3]